MNVERTTRIEVNGKEYGSVEEMPPDVRQLYEEAMRQLREQGPGGPPAAAGQPAAPGSPQVHTTVRTTRRLIVNGEEIRNLDELPEGLRDLVRSALASAGEADTVIVGDKPALEVKAQPAASERRGTMVTSDEPMVVGSKPAREQPVYAEWMKKDRQRRVRVHVSPLHLAFWIGLIILIIYLWLHR